MAIGVAPPVLSSLSLLDRWPFGQLLKPLFVGERRISVILELNLPWTADASGRSSLSGPTLLNEPQHPDPRSCLRRLAGERRGAGIVPCDDRGFRPVHVNHVAGERLLIGTVGGACRPHVHESARNAISATRPRPIRAGMTMGGTNHVLFIRMPGRQPIQGSPRLPQASAPNLGQ